MKPANCIIRKAQPEDAEALSALCRTTFIENFGHMYIPENLHNFMDGVYTTELQKQEIHDLQNHLQVAQCDGKLVAYAKSGICKLPVPKMPQRSYELHRLYVSTEAKGQGIGAELMREALDYFRQKAAEAVFLGVWSGNLAAQKFYAHYGFEKIGEYHFMVGEHADEEWIMQLKSN